MKNGLLLQLLADAVAATPERVYATFGPRTVTMADLDAALMRTFEPAFANGPACRREEV